MPLNGTEGVQGDVTDPCPTGACSEERIVTRRSRDEQIVPRLPRMLWDEAP